MVWTRVVAAEMKRRKRVHIYLEVEPAASAEGPTVDSGGSRITLRSGAGLFVLLAMQATSSHSSPRALMAERTWTLLPSYLNPFVIHTPPENHKDCFSKSN